MNDFPVDYNSIDRSGMSSSRKHLMTKNYIK